MRRVLSLFVAIGVGLAGSAFAADMTPVYKAPRATPVVDPWTGFYVGANGGYSWSQWNSTSLAPIFAGNSFTASPNVDGWVAGFQGGYNWRLDNRWLVGLEGDIQWTGERATNGTSSSVTIGATTITTTFSEEWKFRWFDTFRGRIGALVDSSTMIYLTGGAALGRFDFNELTTATVTTRGVTASASAANNEPKYRWGGVVGAGIERKFTPNWSAKAEFLYLDFGTHVFLLGSGLDTSVRLNDYVARVGVNYKFD